jgi:hypothetical protein
MTSRYRPWQFLLVFVALSLFVAVGVTEFVLRGLAFSSGGGGGRAGARWDAAHWTPINREGLRDVEWAAPDGRPALVFLGDSFTDGHGVDFAQTWAAGVRARLPGQVAYNLGKSGSSTLHEAARYRDFRRRTGIAPATVVLQYFGNDMQGRVGDPPQWQPWPGLEWLARHSEIADVLWTYLESTRSGVPYAEHYFAAYADPAAFAAHRADLLALVGDVHADGARLVLLVFPDLDSEAMMRRSQDAYVGRLRAVFAAGCRPGDLFFDATPLARGFDDRARVVNKLDSHPSPALHAALGARLAPLLSGPTPRHLPAGVEACPASGVAHG